MVIDGPIIQIKKNVFLVRGQRVVPTADAAAFYEVSPASLMRTVRSNPRKFTREAMFRLHKREQAAILALKSRKMPVLVFTELGISMLSTVLRSHRAAAVNVRIIRETVKMMNSFPQEASEIWGLLAE